MVVAFGGCRRLVRSSGVGSSEKQLLRSPSSLAGEGRLKRLKNGSYFSLEPFVACNDLRSPTPDGSNSGTAERIISPGIQNLAESDQSAVVGHGGQDGAR
jgi:hypothetical protein